MLDLVVAGGKLVTESGVFEADVGIENGKISAISRRGIIGSSRRVDATGKFVFPGAIDAHTHLNNTYPFFGVKRAEDHESASIAAACGGVTTFIDFASQVTVSENPRRCKTLAETVGEWRRTADPMVAIDYSLHVIVKEANEETIKEIPRMVESGISSFKVYMAYNALKLDDGGIYSVMKAAASHGALVGVHCENKEINERFEEEYRRAGKATAGTTRQSHPPISEEEAAQRASLIAANASCPMYVVHLSTGDALEVVREARRRRKRIFAETCPHYLTLDDEVYSRPNAVDYRVSPPIRTKRDRAALWSGIVSGDIETIGSDHVCFTHAQKELGKDDFGKAPPGLAGMEVILSLTYDRGVGRGLIDVRRLVELTSSNPARYFGLYPRKGTIAVGSDADLVVFDPEKRVRLSQEALHSRTDHSIYDDITVEGYPIVTISRGEVVFEDGGFAGKPGRGAFVKRSKVPRDLYF